MPVVHIVDMPGIQQAVVTPARCVSAASLQRSSCILSQPSQIDCACNLPTGVHHACDRLQCSLQETSGRVARCRYGHPDIIITENGVCLPGEAEAALPGVLNDTMRIDFHRDYVQSAMQAVALDKVRARWGARACIYRRQSEHLAYWGCRRSNCSATTYGASMTTGSGLSEQATALAWSMWTLTTG